MVNALRLKCEVEPDSMAALGCAMQVNLTGAFLLFPGQLGTLVFDLTMKPIPESSYKGMQCKDTEYKRHLSNEDTVCCPNHIELCTNLPLN